MIINKLVSINLIILLILSCHAYNLNASEYSEYFVSSKLIASYSSIKNGTVSGNYAPPLYIYSDQDHDKNDNNTSDIVGGALLTLGYKTNNWIAELSYSYRFRFDLNGNVGEPVEGKYERHDNLPGRFKLDINTQSTRIDFKYLVPSWQTDFLNPFISFNVDFLTHRIISKVRNRYNYSEKNIKDSDTTFGLGLGTEFNWHKNINWVVSVNYIDLGKIEIGPQSNGAYFKSNRFNSIDVLFGINYYF